MANETTRPSVRMLALISTPQLVRTAIGLFHKSAVPIQYQSSAIGTATSEIIDALGLGSTEKSILISMMPTPVAHDMLRTLRKALKMYMPNSGIAFTVPLTGITNHALRMLSTLNENENALPTRRDSMNGSETKYALIAVAVNQGFSEEVMLAAKSAGARSGTLIHSRRVTDETTLPLWGMNDQEEKEIVLILTAADAKAEMMQAIGKRCGMNTEAKGLVFSMPIDSVVGIGEEE